MQNAGGLPGECLPTARLLFRSTVGRPPSIASISSHMTSASRPSVVRPPLRLLSVVHVHVHVHVYADGNSDSNIEAVEGARGDGREHEDYFSPVSAAFIPLPRLALPRLARQSVSRHNEARQPPLFRIPVCRPPARSPAAAWRGEARGIHGMGMAALRGRSVISLTVDGACP